MPHASCPRSRSGSKRASSRRSWDSDPSAGRTRTTTMKVVVTGSTGLIGSALVTNLRADGHEVRRLVRHAPRAADETQWHPSSGVLEPSVVDGVDAVVHLAGA